MTLQSVPSRQAQFFRIIEDSELFATGQKPLDNEARDRMALQISESMQYDMEYKMKFRGEALKAKDTKMWLFHQMRNVINSVVSSRYTELIVLQRSIEADTEETSKPAFYGAMIIIEVKVSYQAQDQKRVIFNAEPKKPQIPQSLAADIRNLVSYPQWFEDYWVWASDHPSRIEYGEWEEHVKVGNIDLAPFYVIDMIMVPYLFANSDEDKIESRFLDYVIEKAKTDRRNLVAMAFPDKARFFEEAGFSHNPQFDLKMKDNSNGEEIISSTYTMRLFERPQRAARERNQPGV